MKRRSFLKGLGIGAVGMALGTYNFDRFLEMGSGLAPGQTGGLNTSSEAAMLYREIPHTGQKVSVLSLGIGSLHESSDVEITRIVDYALGRGINLMDMVMPAAGPAEAIGRGMKSRRKDVIAQLHIGAYFNMAGVTDRTRKLQETKSGFEEQLRLYGSGDSDIGMIHYVDQPDDYDAMLNDNPNPPAMLGRME